MNAQFVSRPEKDLFDRLREIGYAPTGDKTETGEFWRHEERHHISVPFSVQGNYPGAVLWRMLCWLDESRVEPEIN